MPSVDDVLSSFTPSGTPEAAAEAFAAHAEKAGFERRLAREGQPDLKTASPTWASWSPASGPAWRRPPASR